MKKKKGDELTLIPIEDGFLPGKRTKAIIQDCKDGIITVACYDFISCMCVMIEELVEVFYLKHFLGPVKHNDGFTSPAIMQLKPDSIVNAFLNDEVLKPTFNREKLRYEYGMSEGSLARWVEAGVLVCETVHSFYSCPECDVVLGVRKGCRNCMSAKVGKKSRSVLLRHTACGYVGYGHQFDNWRCPSCKERVVEGGYEQLRPPLKCDDCGFLNDSQPHYVGMCLACRGSFHLRDVLEVPVFSYSRHRPR